MLSANCRVPLPVSTQPTRVACLFILLMCKLQPRRYQLDVTALATDIKLAKTADTEYQIPPNSVPCGQMHTRRLVQRLVTSTQIDLEILSDQYGEIHRSAINVTCAG